MSKPVWETRFDGLSRVIRSHKDSNLETLGRMAIENQSHHEGLDTEEYWKAVGKAEILDQLVKSAHVWERF